MRVGLQTIRVAGFTRRVATDGEQLAASPVFGCTAEDAKPDAVGSLWQVALARPHASGGVEHLNGGEHGLVEGGGGPGRCHPVAAHGVDVALRRTDCAQVVARRAAVGVRHPCVACGVVLLHRREEARVDVGCRARRAVAAHLRASSHGPQLERGS